jgi:hypothetical protein
MRVLTFVCVLLAAAGCEHSDLGTPGGPGPGDPPPLLTPPGGGEWGDEKVSCGGEGDCGAGETCTDGVCQMKRCVGGEFSSRPPLGKTYAFFDDSELLVADADARDGGYHVDRYEPVGAAITFPSGGSTRVGDTEIVDIVGGRFFDEREGFATAIVASAVVTVRTAEASREVTVGFVPVGLGHADLDGDHQDELLAIGAGGRVAVCRVEAGDCDQWTIGSLDGVDLDGGDVDGDGSDEIVLLQTLAASRRRVLVWDFGAEGDEATPRGLDLDAKMTAIAIGDVDKDGVDDIGLLTDGGYLGVAGDALHLYTGLGGLAWRRALTVDGDAVAVAIGDSNADEQAEIVVLADHPVADNTIAAYVAAEQGFTEVYAGKVSATDDGDRLALADLDGDSPRGTLIEGPTLLAAEAVPTLVVMFPPYDREHSDGLPFLEVGESKSSSSSVSDTIALRLGAEVGVEFGVSGLFKAKVAARVDAELSRTRSKETSRTIGSRLSASPNPEGHGFAYGAVVLSCGCYHGYRYRLSDPAHKLGGDGKQISVLLPVGGQTTLWSTTRYNAMARATGKLPEVPVPMRLGDLSTYPSEATTLEGTPIAPEDLVFPEAPEYVASDVGSVGFSLSAGASTTNSDAMSVGVSLVAGVNVEGVEVGASVGVGVGRGTSVTVGEEASFSGGIPPVPDRPGTPEDEYTRYAYRFRPVVYKARYQAADGSDAGYYVVTYEVAR